MKKNCCGQKGFWETTHRRHYSTPFFYMNGLYFALRSVSNCAILRAKFKSLKKQVRRLTFNTQKIFQRIIQEVFEDRKRHQRLSSTMPTRKTLLMLCSLIQPILLYSLNKRTSIESPIQCFLFEAFVIHKRCSWIQLSCCRTQFTPKHDAKDAQKAWHFWLQNNSLSESNHSNSFVS